MNVPEKFTFVHEGFPEYLCHAKFKVDGCCVVTWDDSEYASGLMYSGSWAVEQLLKGTWIIIGED